MATAKKTTSKRVTKKEALTSCGTRLKPGYKFLKGGGVAKVTPVKKKSTKKGLGSTTCTRQNSDGSSTTYTGQGGSNPCPHGGRPTATRVNRLTPAGTTFGLGKRKPAKKRTPKRK